MKSICAGLLISTLLASLAVAAPQASVVNPVRIDLLFRYGGQLIDQRTLTGALGQTSLFVSTPTPAHPTYEFDLTPSHPSGSDHDGKTAIRTDVKIFELASDGSKRLIASPSVISLSGQGARITQRRPKTPKIDLSLTPTLLTSTP